jgi:methionyl-tRNA formyltransferase
MKPKLVFFGSDQYSEIVFNCLSKNKRFKVEKFFPNSTKQPDVGILASYGRILAPKALNFPKHGVLNIHPSLLPKHRGPTPVPTALLKNEKVVGVTIFKMDEKVDHGPILAQFKETIKPDENAEDLLKRLFKAGAKVLLTILPAYLEGKIKLRKQDHKKATYTKKFTRADGKIDWQKPASYLERLIRAMQPWPGAWTMVKIKPGQKPKRLKILKAHLKNKKLILDQVQLEGKKPVAFKQFQEGYPEAKING